MFKTNFGILNSGINLDVFYPIDRNVAREKLSLSIDKKIILFSGSFINGVKNFQLATAAIKLLNEDIQIIEPTGFSREEIMLLMNASNLLLVTSKHESGPNVTKEALACNTPVVSTKVGHEKIIDILENTEGCYVTDFNVVQIANAIKEVFTENKRINSREKILIWDMNEFAKRTKFIYETVNSLQRKKCRIPKIVFP